MSELTEKISGHETIYIYSELQAREHIQWTELLFAVLVLQNPTATLAVTAEMYGSQALLAPPKDPQRYLWPHFLKLFLPIRAVRLSVSHLTGQNHPLPIPSATCSLNQWFSGCSQCPVVLYKDVVRSLQRLAKDYQLTTSVWLLWCLESWVHKFGKH